MKKIFCTTIALSLCLAAAAFGGSAVEGPGVRVLDSIKNAYSPVTFDHAKHVSLAGNCASCHHEHTMGEGLPCKQCHAITPAVFKSSVSHSFMACKTCHGTFDRDNAAMPGLKTAYHVKCFSCHRGMGNIGTDPKGCAELCHEKKADKLSMGK